MATMYFVQRFLRKGKKLEPAQPEKMRSPEAAIARAERIGASAAGVWAYAQEIDAETDTYGDPEVLFKAGILPQGLDD